MLTPEQLRKYRARFGERALAIRDELSAAAGKDPGFRKRIALCDPSQADAILQNSIIDQAVNRIFELEAYVQALESQLQARH